MSPQPRHRTVPGTGGNWHIYPGGRRVFVRKPAGAAMGGGKVGPAAAGVATRAPLTPGQQNTLSTLENAYTSLSPQERLRVGGARMKPAAKPAGSAAAPGAASTRPVDPGFLQEGAAISKAYEQQVAGVTQQRQAGVAEWGLGEDLKFDPNNPLSKAALLKKNYDATRKVTGLGMGAGGGLYSGAYQSGQNAINRAQVGEEDQLQKNFTEFLRQNSADYATAGTDYGAAMGRAESDRMGRINENPLYEPTSNLAPGATGKPKKPKKKKGRR